MRTTLLLAILLTLLPVWGQKPEGPSRENLPPGDNVVGKVTSAGKDSLIIAPLAGGDPITVKIGENTQVSKAREPIKIEDVKMDDIIFARGELKNNVMQAGRIAVVNPQMVQKFGQGGMSGPMAFNREDLGKKFIAGEVKAINETRITVARPDNQSQDIEVDENTSFKRGNESITLPDIKVGDFVRGPGELKNGVFVPKELMVGRPQMRMMMVGPGGQNQETPPGAVPAPSPQPPK
jgi:Domain of unknown function (DUF5666)